MVLALGPVDDGDADDHPSQHHHHQHHQHNNDTQPSSPSFLTTAPGRTSVNVVNGGTCQVNVCTPCAISASPKIPFHGMAIANFVTPYIRLPRARQTPTTVSIFVRLCSPAAAAAAAAARNEISLGDVKGPRPSAPARSNLVPQPFETANMHRDRVQCPAHMYRRVD